MRLLYFLRFDAPRHTSWNWRSQRSSPAVAETTARWKTVQNFSSSPPFDEERDFAKRGVDQIWRGFWIKLYIETLVPNLKTITIFSHSAKCWLTFCFIVVTQFSELSACIIVICFSNSNSSKTASSWWWEKTSFEGFFIQLLCALETTLIRIVRVKWVIWKMGHRSRPRRLVHQ